MNKELMKARTKRFTLRVIHLVQALPRNMVGEVLGKQLLRSGTSVGANYRAVCRAKSRADFINKLKVVEEECDEALFWMELLVEAEQMTASRLMNLMNEADEILSIVVSAAKTARTTPLTRKSQIVNLCQIQPKF